MAAHTRDERGGTPPTKDQERFLKLSHCIHLSILTAAVLIAAPVMAQQQQAPKRADCASASERKAGCAPAKKSPYPDDDTAYKEINRALARWSPIWPLAPYMLLIRNKPQPRH